MSDLLRILVAPSGLGTLLFLLGIAALAAPRLRRWSRPLLIASGGVLSVFSFGPVATLLLAPLEYEHPALVAPERYQSVRTIVLLTAYASADPDMPLSSRMNSSSAFRVLETASLATRRPDCRIVISGNATAAEAMGAQLKAMGIAPQRIAFETGSKNTAASARNLVALLGPEPVFLVTSAGHMRRSLAAFTRNGIHVVPAPADHQMPSDIAHAEWSMSPFNLHASDLALHEYAGLLWYRLTGSA